MTFDPLARYLNQRSARFERRALLRPMAVNEMADAALRAYRALGGPSLKLTAVPALFGAAAIFFLYYYVLPMFSQTSNVGNLNVQVFEAIMVLALAVGVALPLIIFAAAYSSALITGMVADFMVGNLPDPEAARKAALANMGRIFKFGVREAFLGSGGIIIGSLLIMLSALLSQQGNVDFMSGVVSAVGVIGLISGFLVFPFVYGWECLAVPAILVEGLSVRAAAARSRKLMRAYGRQPGGFGYVFNAYGMIFLLMLFLGVGVVGATSLLQVFETLAGAMRSLRYNELLSQVLSILPIFLAVWLLIPVWATMTTILYFERRVRLEGYDIETLGRDVWRISKSSRFQL